MGAPGPDSRTRDRTIPNPLHSQFHASFNAILISAPFMRIHFICTGNIYRSRLAEAYCASCCGPGIHVFSSGVAAGSNGDFPISPYAADILTQYALTSYAAPRWQRTTAALVHASDVLVFMEPEHRIFCQDWIEPERQRMQVWDVEDVGPIPASEIAPKVDRTFAIIRKRTDALLATLGLRHTGLSS
jgi:protein-tyrosine-phosphatase